MIERVDLVDANGIIQQRGVPRSKIEVLFPDLHLQIVIGIIFNNSGEILVHKRSMTKKVDPGLIDHVCGGVISGETPEEAVFRETKEETGLIPTKLKLIHQGLNSYGRYRYSFIGYAEGQPFAEQKDAEWVKFIKLETLKSCQKSGEMIFVNEFFEETELALSA